MSRRGVEKQPRGYHAVLSPAPFTAARKLTVHPLTVTDLRTFVPAQDFALSRAFYEAIGWAVVREDDHLAVIDTGAHRFYLQNSRQGMG